MSGDVSSRISLSAIVQGIYNTTVEAVTEVWDESVQQVKAIPQFARNMWTSTDTRTLVKNTGVIVATDLVPIVAAQAGMIALESALLVEGSDPSFMISAGLFLARWSTRIFTTRQSIEALTRIGVLQAKQSSIFDKATRDSRQKLNAKVCEDCSNMRFITGGVRGPLVFGAQQGVIFLLNKLLGGYAAIGGFDLIVDSYRAQVIGQLVMAYRLSNDGLCERHQAEYHQQFWHRVFALGLPVVLVRKLIAALIESYTGVDSSYYGSMLESFISIGMVGLAHDISLPEPVKESKRWPDPASIVRNSATYAIDKIGPNLVEQAKSLFAQDGEPFDYRKAYRYVVNVYKDPKTQRVMMFIVPKMYLGANEFANDAVVRDYWPALQDSIITVLGKIEEYQPMVTDGLVSFVPNPVIAWAIGVPKGTVNTASNLLSDPDIMRLVGELKDGVTRMEVEVNDKGIIATILDSVIPTGLFSPTTVIEEVDEPDVTDNISPYKSKMDSYNFAQCAQAIVSAILRYHKTVANGNGGFWSGHEGKMRASFYLELLNTERPIEDKLVVCLAVLQNNSGNTLLYEVTKALNFQLPLYIKSQSSSATALSLARKEVIREWTGFMHTLVGCQKSSVAKMNLGRLVQTIISLSNSKLPISEQIENRRKVYLQLDELKHSLKPEVTSHAL